MKPPPEKEAIRNSVKMLSDLLGEVPRNVDDEPTWQGRKWGAVVHFKNWEFILEYKRDSRLSSVSSGVEALKNIHLNTNNRAIPLVVVPRMEEKGQIYCREAGISWLDLSGNCLIRGENLHLSSRGNKNPFKSTDGFNVFAPKSSRVVRWLLHHPNSWSTQQTIGEQMSLQKGYVSQVVSQLEEDGLVIRNAQGAIRLQNPHLLLEAWQEAYRFEKHDVLKGSLFGRTPWDIVLRMVGELENITGRVKQNSGQFALTGLAAAWGYSPFADFRLVTIFVTGELLTSLLEEMEDFHQESKGANVWLVVPNDNQVFYKMENEKLIQGQKIPCVHPIQVYLDLKGHPERAKEAAERLRQDHLTGEIDG